MPSYCTVAEVRSNHERIPNSGDEDGIISGHILRVSALVDGYIRGKVTLPFEDDVPDIVIGVALDLATYRTLRSLFGSQTEEFQTWVREYKDPAMDILDQIRECTISLDPDDATAYDKVKSNTKGKEAIFNLAHPYDQDYHPTDGDNRYGE